MDGNRIELEVELLHAIDDHTFGLLSLRQGRGACSCSRLSLRACSSSGVVVVRFCPDLLALYFLMSVSAWPGQKLIGQENLDLGDRVAVGRIRDGKDPLA